MNSITKAPAKRAARTKQPAARQALRNSKFTYGDLCAFAKSRYAEENRPGQAFRNALTALNGFMAHSLRTANDTVQAELFGNFDSVLGDYLQALQTLGLAKATIRDRLSLLLKWRTYAQQLAEQQSLPLDFRARLVALVDRSGLSRGTIARLSGVNRCTLRDWMNGRIHPRPSSAGAISALEKRLGAKEGVLVDLVAPALTEQYQPPACHFRSTIRKLVEDPFVLPPTVHLQHQWSQLLRFKTQPTLPSSVQRRSAWRTKPLHRVSFNPGWESIIDGEGCATAHVFYHGLRSYLSWLALSEARGGMAMPHNDAFNLAWLTDTNLLLKHAEWHRQRVSGTYCRTTTTFWMTIVGLLRAETGFLWQHPELANGVALLSYRDFEREVEKLQLSSEEVWYRWCETSRRRLLKTLRDLKVAHKIQSSRDTKFAIRDILALDRPMTALRDLVRNMQARIPPSTRPSRRRQHMRDLLLVRLLMWNPLRIHHYAVLTYRKDNKGDLYKTSSGAWRIRFGSLDFKNQNGAASSDYDVEVSPTLWPSIEEYLADVRPHLLGAADCEYLFRPVDMKTPKQASYRTKPWNVCAITHRFLRLTRRFIPGNPGFGPHAFRTIITTDYLKRNPGDYQTAGAILNDLPQTVKDAYDKSTTDNKLRPYRDYHDALMEDES